MLDFKDIGLNANTKHKIKSINTQRTNTTTVGMQTVKQTSYTIKLILCRVFSHSDVAVRFGCTIYT